LGSVIIAIAWLGARPMLSLSIIAVAVGIAFMLGKFGKKKVVGNMPKGTDSTPPEPPQNSAASTPPPRRETTPPPRR